MSKQQATKKDLQEELKVMERSLKRTTSINCDYEILEDVAKRFLKIRERCTVPERIAIQAVITERRDAFFEGEGLGIDLKQHVLAPSEPSRSTFNQAMLSIFSKKPPEATLAKVEKKLVKLRNRVKKDFQEIAFREEFYFEKITRQILSPYKKTMAPFEYETLLLVNDFQDRMRLFNWNVVDKDPQVEFLFQLFELLRVKRSVVNVDMRARLADFLKAHEAALDRSSMNARLMNLLHVAMRLSATRSRIRQLEAVMFAKPEPRRRPRDDAVMRGYIKQLRVLGRLVERYQRIARERDADDMGGTTGPAVQALIDLVDHAITPADGNDVDSILKTFQNEARLVKFITRLFGKIFVMLKKKRTLSDTQVMGRLFSEVALKERRRLAILLAMVSCNAVIGMIIPLLFKNLVDVGFGDETFAPDINYIYGTGITFLIFSSILVLFHIFANYLIQYLANKTMYRMRARMFDNLQKLSLDYFNAQPAGKIISYITNDVETIQQVISQGLLTVFVQVFQLVGSVFLMFYISWQLALVSFSIIPFLLVLGAFVFGKARKYFVITRVKIANVTTHTQESIAGMRVIQAFAIENKDASTFKRATNEELEINLKAAKLFASLPGLIMAVLSAGIAVLLLTGGHLFIQNLLGLEITGFTRGSLFSFIMYLLQFFGPIVQLMMFVSSIQNSMAAGERIIKLIDEKPTVQEHVDSLEESSPAFQAIHKDNVRLTFENVNFEYEKGIPVLKDVSLKVKPKERLAIVGYTGAGKTTFISLLSRFWDPTSGRILINGVDIRHFKLEVLRQLMGIVLQDNFLFSGSVMDNIKYGKPGASDEQVFQITRKLGIHDFILQMENGYETPVRERGSRLSVGQKQMIAFARALLVDPPILILDEATSAIDPYSETIVKNALDVLLKERTSITIAHRLSTVLNSDRILVIDDGRIVEEGAHDDLILKEGGLYRHLYELQYARSP